MDLGIMLAPHVGDTDAAVLAEQLGFSHLWVADSQMLWSDVYVVMALIAQRTKRIKIGTGVAVAGTRSPSVTAAAHATINAIAPGRVFCGLGVGHTAMHLSGRRPLSPTELRNYVVELRALLDGKTATVSLDGKDVLVEHVMPGMGFVEFEPRIPLFVSAFGPKAIGIASELADGIITWVPFDPAAAAATIDNIKAQIPRNDSSGDTKSFLTAAVSTMVVLRPGETLDSPRVIEQAGPFAIGILHYAWEQWRRHGTPPPDSVLPVWDDYLASLESTPIERRPLRVHQGHDCFMANGEERFLTRELLESSCLIGTADDLVDRLRELEKAGLQQFVMLPPLASKDQVMRDVAELVMPHVCFNNGLR